MRGFFVKNGEPVYFGERSDKPRLEAGHEFVPSDDPRADALMAGLHKQAPKMARRNFGAELDTVVARLDAGGL